MSSITTDQGIVHYEVYGRGRPVILLHGWLGSWGLWQETMAYLGRSYRTYALDFWGFGESGKKRETYAVQDFVTLVDQFMDRLGIAQAPLVGHSMGGTVSLSVAVQYPQRVNKVVVIGSPIVGSSLAFPLKLAGYRFVASFLFNMMWAFRGTMKIASPFICNDPRFSLMMDRDLTSTTLESFLRSIASLRKTDLRPILSKVNVPVMGMYGGRDNIVSPGEWKPLSIGIPNAKIIRWPRAQHFVMLDTPQDFMGNLKTFLDHEGDQFLMETSPDVYYYPNRMGRIIFLAFEEILGRNGINALANLAGLSDFIEHYPPNNQTLAFSFDVISRLQDSLEKFYGPHGGRGMALRIGRACFQHGLREFGPLFGLTDLAFRLLPLKAKLKIGAVAFADIFNNYTDQRVRLEEKDNILLWHIERCPLCWERKSDTVVCQMAVGLLQEALYWISGGKYFNVEEIHCIANGDPACTILIDKTPMS